MRSSLIYLDNNATTPLDPRVLAAMMPYLTEKFGNAASRSHRYGWDAEEAVEKARGQVAELIGASDKEIVFTSGATESDNLAIKGTVEMLAEKGRHIITCQTEHKAVIDPCKYLESKGVADVTFLDPDRHGRVSAEQVRAALRDDTILITLMTANNEIGTIHPIAEIGAVAKEKGIWFHTDATQAIGKIPFDVEALKVDMASMSGHKIYGPKGVGALYVRRRNPRVRLAPVIHGGGHERGMRSGTLNVPGIVGLGEAARLCMVDREKDLARIKLLRDRLEARIRAALDHVELNGDPSGACPPPSTSPSPTSKASRSSWACRTWRSRPARPAPRPASSRPTCCARWASATSWPTPPSASASAASRPSRTSTRPPTRSSRPCAVCARCLRSTRWSRRGST
jgi:cysteine desulfurase